MYKKRMSQDKEVEVAQDYYTQECIIPTTHDTRRKMTQGGILGSLRITSATPSNPNKSQVEDQLELLEKMISDNLELIAALDIKLGPIMTPEVNSKTEECPRPMLVPLAESLYELTDRVEHQNRCLSSILNRVEI